MKKKLLYRLLLPTLISLFSSTASAQTSPVQWEFSAKPIGANLYEVQLSASIKEGWYLYSQQLPSDGINLPTSFIFFNVILKGGLKEEGKLQKSKDESLQIESWYFKNKVIFKGVVEAKSLQEAIKGSVEFQACTAEKCLNPISNNFSIAINQK